MGCSSSTYVRNIRTTRPSTPQDHIDEKIELIHLGFNDLVTQTTFGNRLKLVWNDFLHLYHDTSVRNWILFFHGAESAWCKKSTVYKMIYQVSLGRWLRSAIGRTTHSSLSYVAFLRFLQLVHFTEDNLIRFSFDCFSVPPPRCSIIGHSSSSSSSSLPTSSYEICSCSLPAYIPFSSVRHVMRTVPKRTVPLQLDEPHVPMQLNEPGVPRTPKAACDIVVEEECSGDIVIEGYSFDAWCSLMSTSARFTFLIPLLDLQRDMQNVTLSQPIWDDIRNASLALSTAFQSLL